MADVAWTTILTPEGQINPGDSVSAGDLGDDGEAELEQLKAAGAVRETDYPEDVGPNESVRERNIRVVNEKMEEIQDSEFDMPELASESFSVVPVPDITEEGVAAANKEVTPPKRAAAKSSE
jgi:hypothetical protein